MSDGAQQSEVTKVGHYRSEPEAVWRLVRDFGGIADIMDGVPEVETEGEGVGQLRKIPAAAGGTIVESLDVRDEEARTLVYSIVEGPLPFKDYSATMVVTPDGDGSTLTWTGRFEADGIAVEKAERLAGNIYASGIEGYRKALGEPAE